MSTPHQPKMTGMKACIHCKRNLPVIFFSVRKDNSDGLDSRCRECRKLYQDRFNKRKKWNKENPYKPGEIPITGKIDKGYID